MFLLLITKLLFWALSLSPYSEEQDIENVKCTVDWLQNTLSKYLLLLSQLFQSMCCLVTCKA